MHNLFTTSPGPLWHNIPLATASINNTVTFISIENLWIEKLKMQIYCLSFFYLSFNFTSKFQKQLFFELISKKKCITSTQIERRMRKLFLINALISLEYHDVETSTDSNNGLSFIL